MSKKIIVNIGKLLQQEEMSLRELSRLTDIRHATLSELANQKRKNINFNHIEKIADALDIEDIRDIISIEDL
ncbi:MAG: helix-turn-helix transcriptional regulator [Turicibacter sp.]|nr:helix-turn-helix transcriptional regulator [Turicibacter sp.]